MKCPKCGYNSFEFLDNCKKCSIDLVAFKDSLGIRPVILPFMAKAAEAPAMGFTIASSILEQPVPENIAEPLVEDNSFSWDESLAEESPKQEESIPGLDMGSVQGEKDDAGLFSFGEESPTDSFGEFSFEEVAKESSQQAAALSAVQPPVEESFADLLESNSSVETPFATVIGGGATLEFEGFAEAAAVADTKESTPVSFDAAQDEFEMEDFFAQEENPAPAKAAKSVIPEQEGVSMDEFDFLFGSDESEKEKTAQ